MWLSKAISILVIVFMINCTVNCIFADTKYIDDHEFESNGSYFLDDCTKTNDKYISDLQNSIRSFNRPIPLSNGDKSGGCYEDNFGNEQNIGSKQNITYKNNDYELEYYDKIYLSDNFEGTDGTFIETYNSSYSFVTTAGSNGGLEIDNAQYYSGSTSALFWLTQYAKDTYLNIDVNLTKPIIEVEYFYRKYTTVATHLGCTIHMRLLNGSTLFRTYTSYGLDHRYHENTINIDSGIDVSHSTWYKVKMIFYKIGNDFSKYDLDVWNTANLVTPVVSKTGLSIGIPGLSSFDNISFRLRTNWDNNGYAWLDDFTVREKWYNAKGQLETKTIILPPNMKWDTFFINKTEPKNCTINVNILNATNDQEIITAVPIDGEVDISSQIDSNKYKQIKLQATLISKESCTPVLNSWGISWNSTNAWRDSFFGGVKVDSKTKVTSINGKARFEHTGTLTSSEITVPYEYYFEELVLNETEPSGGIFKITIFDAKTNNSITGYKDITQNDIDLSGIDIRTVPTIKLESTYTTSGDNGILHDWSVNWTKNVKPKIMDVNSVQTVNRTSTVIININLTDQEDLEEDLNLTVKYKSPIDVTWKTEYLGSKTFTNNRWEVPFTPPASARLGEYTFLFLCDDFFQYQDIYQDPIIIEVINNNPKILNITTSSLQINRTKTMDIYIDPIDIETSVNGMTVVILYKAPSDIEWKTEFISNILYQNNRWEGKFTPSKSAQLGLYSINISCNDSVSEMFDNIQIMVINNNPEQPTVVLIPDEPRTTNDLDVLVSKGKDVETPTDQIEFWYRWYVDDIYIPGYDNFTQIPSNLTAKHETWFCEVFAFDGDDLGNPGFVEITINNSAPEVIEPFDRFEINEDQKVTLKNKLANIFNDSDADDLTFSVIGQENVDIQIFTDNGTMIFTPAKDWFGVEYITFYAKDDDLASANETLILTVNPTNDLPKIKQIGSQIITGEPSKLEFVVKQKDWLNLSIGVNDIDGDVERDMINYIMNITERANLYFKKSGNELVFHPSNADVGILYLTIRITDNNETPPIYISQDIQVQILNVNDPPTASILQPSNNKKFVDAKQIILDCEADDIDFYIPNPNEELSYKWESNITGHHILSFDKRIVLTNETLPKPGAYYIRLTVTDKAGLNATETINIIIQKTPRERETGESEYGDYFMLAMILIIVIILIIIALLLFTTTQRKKHEREAAIGLVAPLQEVLQPVESYRPEPEAPTVNAPVSEAGGVVSAPITADRLSGAAVEPAQSQLAPTPTATIEPTPAPQLPLTQPQTPTPAGIEDKEEMAPQEKIKLLEQRLLKGEVDQDVYLNLKAKYDLEAKPFVPSPQLPPASDPGATTLEPEPIPPIQESDTPQPIIEPPVETPPVTEAPPISETPPEPIQESTPKLVQQESTILSDLPPDAYQQPPETPAQPQSEQPAKEKPKTEEEEP